MDPLKPFADLLHEMKAEEMHLASEIVKLMTERQTLARIKSRLEDVIDKVKKSLGDK